MTTFTHRAWAEANARALRLIIAEIRYGGDSTTMEQLDEESRRVAGEVDATEGAESVMMMLAQFAAQEMLHGWDGEDQRDPDEIVHRLEGELLSMLDSAEKAGDE